MENIVLDSITIVVDSLAMVAALVTIGVYLYTYYKTYDLYRYQELCVYCLEFLLNSFWQKLNREWNLAGSKEIWKWSSFRVV